MIVRRTRKLRCERPLFSPDGGLLMVCDMGRSFALYVHIICSDILSCNTRGENSSHLLRHSNSPKGPAMPLVRIDHSELRTNPGEISAAIHDAILAIYAIPERDRFPVITSRPAAPL